MTELRGWSLPSLPEQHLLPDAVVAFVDGELSPTAHDRAAAHLARCPYCAAEAATQRHARTAMKAAPTPSAPAGLLASLMSIPQDVELPSGPDNLAVTEDGQLVTVQRPGKAGEKLRPFGSAPAFGSSQPLGSGHNVLGNRVSRRTKQGAGVVVSGLVLGAIAIVTMHGDTPAANDTSSVPVDANSIAQVQPTTSTTPTTVTQLPTR
ncbi:anti-sigma factor family protein [Kutzneria kofuensis]|uniref:Anti-sigma factor RsiW n=1 Tax=Kutzneria kofuensis TaxID=103725 RepID=A0A7W9NGL1_9PSEU|nr:zf-HC2 domain-containing protein [Kutzneria kofuensis]MBB5891654.1 anti-sigma factor RsiW [Kutzneria kofuensis]